MILHIYNFKNFPGWYPWSSTSAPCLNQYAPGSSAFPLFLFYETTTVRPELWWSAKCITAVWHVAIESSKNGETASSRMNLSGYVGHALLNVHYCVLFYSMVMARIRVGIRFSVWLVSCTRICNTFDCHCHIPRITGSVFWIPASSSSIIIYYVLFCSKVVTVYCLHFYIRLVSNCWKLLPCLNILKIVYE